MLPSLYALPFYDFDLRASHALTLLPAALASVPFGFVLARVRVRVPRAHVAACGRWATLALRVDKHRAWPLASLPHTSTASLLTYRHFSWHYLALLASKFSDVFSLKFLLLPISFDTPSCGVCGLWGSRRWVPSVVNSISLFM